ncbi:MAG TPA: amino acid adenylation domain-containing protein, partial [Gemmatimonadaceae bacterium]
MATRIAIEEPFDRGPPSTASPDESTLAARREGVRAAPLSFAQERLWFLDQLEPQLPVYNVPRAMHLSGALDPAILDRALNEVARRHGSLRTTFGLVDGVPQQFVAPSLHLRCVLRDLRELPEAERRAAAARQAAIEAATPFDLQRGPLVRALLLRLAAEESILVITMHHIVSEGGWSMNIFLRELGSLYSAFQRGESSSLAPLPIQYHEYAVWQREELDDDHLARDLEYWREQLRGAPTVIELPGDRSRSAARGYRGDRTELRLPHHLSERIRALSRAEGATVTMALLAGWAAVVARYTGSSDLLIGMPVAGRSRLETEALIGLFLNTLALRVDCSGDPSFHELLGRIRSVALGAYDHQELPFERLVKELRPERVGSRTPLVQLIFAPQPPAGTTLSLPDINASPYELGTGTTIADATLFSWDEPEGIRLVLEYSSELFDPERMQRMLAHYQTILEGATACPTLSLSELPLLTEMERYRLLVEWNTGSHGRADGGCIHELVGAVAKRSPGATAVAADGERVTYAELNDRAELLASRLRGLGVGPDVIVGIATERSAEMVVGLLGILKAGGAYLPLDPAYPTDRLAFMLADSGTNLLLTQRHLVPRLPEFGGTIIELDVESEPGTRETAALPGRSVSASDLAYVIYTSGSTGRPKGVQITHGALANLLASAQALAEMTQEDVMLAVTTLSFDIAGLEIWLPLMTGARVVVASRAAASDGEQLAALLRDAKATIMQATPATWQLLLRSGWSDGAGLRALCGGEALPRKLAARLLANGCTVWNMYGPTETTIWSTAHRVSPADCDARDDGGFVPIGRPLANTELHVLDPQRQLLPVGVPGELYIGGAGLARGYLGRAELTAERFVPHPFGAGSGDRLYRTGDRVRYHEDGTLEFIGRIDQQIKLRGFRIEPGEIEATLREYPGVRASVVVVRDDEDREPTLVAYLVKKEGSELSFAELLEHLKRQL